MTKEINKPKWISQKEWTNWLNIINKISKSTFEAEFVVDPDDEKTKQIVNYLFKHWDEVKSKNI